MINFCKKSLLFVLPLMLLSSCGTNNYDVAFKEYEFNDYQLLNYEEDKTFWGEVVKKISSMSRSTSYGHSRVYSFSYQNEVKSESHIDYYSNMSKSSTYIKQSQIRAGITLNFESDSYTERWDLKEEGVEKTFVHEYYGKNHVHAFMLDDSGISEPSRFITVLPFLSGIETYKTSKGYYSIYSTRNKNVQYSTIGNQVREKITEEYKQVFFETSLDYELKNGYFISSVVSTNDPSTGEWFDAPKETERESSKYIFEYKGRTKADTTKAMEDYRNYMSDK